MKKRVFFILIFIFFVINFDLAYAFEVNATFRTQNSPPVLNPIGNLTVFVNKIFLHTITATDPDLPYDSLSFLHNSNLTEFLIIQEAIQNPTIVEARIEFFSSNLSIVGIYVINISVRDILGSIDYEVIRLNVSYNNSVPNIISFRPNFTNLTMNEGELRKFNITVIDLDLPYDSLRYAWYFDDYIIPGQIFDNFDFIADYNTAGFHNLTVYVFDQFNASDFNSWNLTIIDVPAPSSSSSGGGSGGGGGGGASCRNNWTCTDWSPCPVYKKQIRICIDSNQCPRSRDKPDEQQNCLYVPPATCDDGILNGNELLVDCGGSCGACPTCNDNIQNQGEEGLDCGGPCPRPCGLIYNPAIYPICGDNICEGIDVVMCPNDCKSSLPLIIVIIVFLTLYLVYAYGKLTLIFSLVNRRRKELDILSSKRVPSLSALNNLLLIKNVIGKENKELLFKKFLSIIREFFSVFFLIKFEYTYEELKKEIKKYPMDESLREKIYKLLDEISKIEFKKEDISLTPFKEALENSLFVVESLKIFEEKRYKEFKIKRKQERLSIIKLPLILIRKIINIFISLESAFNDAKQLKYQIKTFKENFERLDISIRNREMDNAREEYNKIKLIYNELPMKYRVKYHNKLLFLYNSINKS